MPAKILIGVLSNGTWTEKFGLCLVQMLLHITTHKNFQELISEVNIASKVTSMLAKGRHEIAEHALRDKFSHVFFVDTDQTFPPWVLFKLLSDNKDIVACNVATKTRPSLPTARSFVKDDDQGGLIYTTPDSPELERVWQVGTGVMLIRTDILPFLPKPWFLDVYIKEKDEWMGEDWYFTKQASEFGYKVYVDHIASMEVGHEGRWEFTHKTIQEHRVWEEMLQRFEEEIKGEINAT